LIHFYKRQERQDRPGMEPNLNSMEQPMEATTLGVDSLPYSSFSPSGMNQPRRTTTA